MNITKNILVFPHKSARRIATTAHFPCTKSTWFIHVFSLAYSTSSASPALTRSIIIQLRLAGSHLMHSKLFQQTLNSNSENVRTFGLQLWTFLFNIPTAKRVLEP